MCIYYCTYFYLKIFEMENKHLIVYIIKVMFWHLFFSTVHFPQLKIWVLMIRFICHWFCEFVGGSHLSSISCTKIERGGSFSRHPHDLHLSVLWSKVASNFFCFHLPQFSLAISYLLTKVSSLVSLSFSLHMFPQNALSETEIL